MDDINIDFDADYDDEVDEDRAWCDELMETIYLSYDMNGESKFYKIGGCNL